MKGWEQQEGAINKGGWALKAMCVCSCIPECPVVHLWREEWDSISGDRSWVEALCCLPYAPLRVNKKTNTSTHSQHAALLWSGDTDQRALSAHQGSVKPCGDAKVSKHEVRHLRLFALLARFRTRAGHSLLQNFCIVSCKAVQHTQFNRCCMLYTKFSLSHCAFCSAAKFKQNWKDILGCPRENQLLYFINPSIYN